MSEVVLVALTNEERDFLRRLPALEDLIKNLTARVDQENRTRIHHKDLLSPRMVGKLCGCQAETVRKAVVMGKLPAIPVQVARGGRAGLVVRRADAEAWLAKGKPVR